MFSKAIAIEVILMCVTASIGLCQQDAENYIFSIRVTSIDNRQFVQTGFRLRSVQGIITALHGVASARSITALNKKGVVYTHLRISAVDITRDAALLYSEDMASTTPNGYVTRTGETIIPLEKLTVSGHPQGIGLTMKSVSAGNPVRRQLASMIPPKHASAFAKRNSPAPGIDILYIDGSLVPGHSGAPILDQRNNVVGIANGGILGGAAGISWAIPVNDLRFTDVSTARAELEALKYSDSDQLFAFELLDDTFSVYGKHFDTEVFEIDSLSRIEKTISLREIAHDFDFDQSIDAPNKARFHELAQARIISYLDSSSGSAAISQWMTAFRVQHTHGQPLTFAPSITLDSLNGVSEQEALQQLPVGNRYDERWVSIDNIEMDVRYSDRLGSYHGNIKDATLKLVFNAAVCSDVKQVTMSQLDLESKKYNWPKFVVVNVVQR